jgi:hypothetical protein
MRDAEKREKPSEPEVWCRIIVPWRSVSDATLWAPASEEPRPQLRPD